MKQAMAPYKSGNSSPGPTLQDLLETLRENKKIIPFYEGIDFILQILEALRYSHQRKIIHGDLGSHNIYLRQDPAEEFLYQPVVGNLGSNRPDSPERHLRTYETPEQASGSPMDLRADIYSAGMLLYELMTGKSPSFENEVRDIKDQPSSQKQGKP